MMNPFPFLPKFQWRGKGCCGFIHPSGNDVTPSRLQKPTILPPATTKFTCFLQTTHDFILLIPFQISFLTSYLLTFQGACAVVLPPATRERAACHLAFPATCQCFQETGTAHLGGLLCLPCLLQECCHLPGPGGTGLPAAAACHACMPVWRQCRGCPRQW